tara:strand:- start:6269 stop:6640 length:372 start_codon:yes stop_codon:yes gene_type:complete
MKKLTTNQMLIGGGVIALIYILYKKRKGSDMIKDALNGQIPDVSVSDGDKGTNEPVISIPTGETKYKSCYQVNLEYEKRKFNTLEDMLITRKRMFQGCTGKMPKRKFPKKTPRLVTDRGTIGY